MTLFKHPVTGLITITHDGIKEKYVFYTIENAIKKFKSKHGIKGKVERIY